MRSLLRLVPWTVQSTYPKGVVGMMPTQHSATSTIRFASSSDSPAAKPQRRHSRPKNGPVTVRQGPKPEAMAKPRISPATAEALYRTGRMPRIGG